jgi:hypothetical protein
MTVKRLVKFHLPAEIAIRLEVEALKQNMTIHEYCKQLVSSYESPRAKNQIDQIHRMMSDLHKDYFET